MTALRRKRDPRLDHLSNSSENKRVSSRTHDTLPSLPQSEIILHRYGSCAFSINAISGR